MIVISGTGRSGTSLWMQMLRAGGLPVLGDAFPLDWSRTFADANERGFYESSLWNGINSTTNPDPRTGERLDPRHTREVVTKVFLPGLPRSHRAFLHRVIVSVRGWREFDQSRLRADVVFGRDPASTTSTERAWRWWQETRVGAEDIVARGYPTRVVSFDAVLSRPAEVVSPILEWLDAEVDVAAALAEVNGSLRTQFATPTPPGVPEAWVEAFDEVEHHLTEAGELNAAFIERLRQLHGLVRAAKPPASRG